MRSTGERAVLAVPSTVIAAVALALPAIFGPAPAIAGEAQPSSVQSQTQEGSSSTLVARAVSMANEDRSGSDDGGLQTTGWYIGISGGPQSRKISEDVGLGTAAKFKDGFTLNAATGYRFQNGLRLEAEASYQNNRNKSFITLATGASQASVGNVGLRSYMFNAYYDVPIKSQPRLRPFVGGGVGIYQSSINGFTAPSLAAGGIVLSTKSTEVRAWQYRVGVNYAIGRETELSLAYRRFLGTQLRFNFIVPGSPPTFVPLSVTGGNTESVELGIRKYF